MSQQQQILTAMQKGQTITPLDALHRFNCMRLGARIYDLKQQGHRIHTSMITHNGKRYAAYWMGKHASK